MSFPFGLRGLACGIGFVYAFLASHEPCLAQHGTGPAASGAHLGSPGATQSTKPPPNVLLIVADDLGLDMLETYGLCSNYPNTPNINALAASGVKFQNVWSSPVCSPSRAAIHTGRLPSTYGMLWITNPSTGTELPLAELTIPEVIDSFAPNPIATAAFGKWHMANGSFGCESVPNLQGYDRYEGTLWGFWKFPPIDYYYLDNWLVNGVSQTETTYNTTLITDRALAWWQAQTGPRFAYVAFNAPHAPYQLPPQSLCTVNVSQIPLSQTREIYKAMIEALDHELGRLVSTVRAATPDTYIIFTSDNGTPQGMQIHPFSATHGKETVYEGGVRVPLIVTGPGVVAPNREVASLVGLTDIFATTLELLEIDFQTVMAANPTTEFHSFSFVPYLKDPFQSPIRVKLYTESRKPLGFGAYFHQQGARDARFKIRRVLTPTPVDEFYNLLTDPFEQVNLLAVGAPPLTPLQLASYSSLTNFMLDPH